MRKLPVTDAFSHAISSTTSNLAFAFHLSWPWMAVLLPILIGGTLYIVARTGGDLEANAGVVVPVQLLMAVAAMLAFASIAVNWHRYVLLDEVPTGRDRLRLDDKVWRYFGNALLILLIVGLGVGVIGAALGAIGFVAGPVAAVLAFPVGIAIFIFAVMAFYRLSIKLPAVALGRRDFGLSDAWRSSAGNGWQLLGLVILYFLVGIAMSFVLLALGWVLGLIGGPLSHALIIAVQLVVNWVLTILGITLLTSLYGFFVEGRNF